jgi:Putative methyltransferase
VSQRDWFDWHHPYDDPNSPLSCRLRIVQGEIRAAVDRAPVGPVRAVSMCAGQGRDVIGALADHARQADVSARLVEMDRRNVEAARAAAQASGLTGITVRECDASVTDAYEGAVPADLVLACGVFGNIDEDDIRATIRTLPQLCVPRATVIWTRHRLAPDLTPAIRAYFEESGFEEVVFHAPDDAFFGIGVHGLDATPVPLRPGHRMFDFVGHDALEQ